MASKFQVVRPTTVAEAASELDRLGDRARVYAGGAELLLLMREGVLEPEYLVDIKRIEELATLAWEGNLLRIGATVAHHRIESDAKIASAFPHLSEAVSHIGNVRVRTQGTLGGNLCFADPHADPGTPLLLHDTVVAIEGPSGKRTLPLGEFIAGTYATALEPNEILVRVDVPPLGAEWRTAFLRIERFYRPTANVAAAARMSGKTIGEVRMVVGCIGPRPTRLTDLEAELRGATAAEADARLAAASDYLVEQLEPVDDLLGGADYKIYLATVLLRRAVAEVTGAGRAEA